MSWIKPQTHDALQMIRRDDSGAGSRRRRRVRSDELSIDFDHEDAVLNVRLGHFADEPLSPAAKPHCKRAIFRQ
jgi:hypothetical protein